MKDYRKLLNEKLYGRIDGDILEAVVAESDLTKKYGMGNIPYYVATARFKGILKFAEGNFYESAAGVAKSPEEALERVIVNFCECVYDGVLNLYNGGGAEILKSDFFGVNKNWRAFRSRALVLGQNPGGDDYFDLIKDKFNLRLGNRAVYCVKIYGAKKAGGAPVGEVRINDITDYELSDIIEKDALSWNTKGFASKKQFIFASQESDTYIKYPYGYDAIKLYTSRAVRLFLRLKTGDEYFETLSELYNLTNDLALSTELFSFIPEICAERFLEIKADKILIQKDGGFKFYIYKSQSIGYELIFRALCEIFKEGVFSAADLKKIIIFSSVYETYRKSKKLSDHVSIARTPKNYFVR